MGRERSRVSCSENWRAGARDAFRSATAASLSFAGTTGCDTG
jgi:hypothetical protein